MRGIKIPQQDFALKTQGGGGGGAYLRDNTVHVCTIQTLYVHPNT